MCETYSSAPRAIKSAIAPILATMRLPNMSACSKQLDCLCDDHQLRSQVRDWISDSCRQCEKCAGPTGALFDFTQDMSVGNAAIDADHKAFFDLARILHDAAFGPEHGAIAHSTIAILEEYISGHFLREEKAMRSARYPRLAEHRHRHGIFRGRIKAITDTYRQGNASAIDGLPSVVALWLRGHILGDDLNYRNWISNVSVDSRPLVYLAIEAER